MKLWVWTCVLAVHRPGVRLQDWHHCFYKQGKWNRDRLFISIKLGTKAVTSKFYSEQNELTAATSIMCVNSTFKKNNFYRVWQSTQPNIYYLRKHKPGHPWSNKTWFNGKYYYMKVMVIGSCCSSRLIHIFLVTNSASCNCCLCVCSGLEEHCTA